MGPKAKDVGGTGAEADIGSSFPCDAVGSKMAVGVRGGLVGGWQEELRESEIAITV